MGYGRVNAEKAVSYANDMHVEGLDLYMEDLPNDFGIEPPLQNGIQTWISEDIWIRNQDDGLTNQVHQNPIYDPNNPVYVYVRVTNKGCDPSGGQDDDLHLYWAKASTALYWPNSFDGSITSPALMGDEIDDLVIPALDPGESTIIQFEWYPPDPDDYSSTNPNPWHFCLLARIVSTGDGMAVTETSDLWSNVFNNNNIVQKNVTVVDHQQQTSEIGGAIAIGNVSTTTADTFEIVFQSSSRNNGNLLIEQAEVYVRMDATTYQNWFDGGSVCTNLQEILTEVYELTDEPAKLSNIPFDAGEISTLSLEVNFLTEEVDSTLVLYFDVTQLRYPDGDTIGGEEFVFKKDPQRDLFEAEYSSMSLPTTNQLSTSSTPAAQTIFEPASYEWVNELGQVIDSGMTISALSLQNSTSPYRLRVTAKSDGYRDYADNLFHVLTSNYIVMINPNPVSSVASVSLQNITKTGTITVSNPYSGVVKSQVINPGTTLVNVDLSSLPSGIYSVTVTQGLLSETKYLVRN